MELIFRTWDRKKYKLVCIFPFRLSESTSHKCNSQKALEYRDKGNLKLGFVKWDEDRPSMERNRSVKQMCQLVKCVALYRHEGSFILSPQMQQQGI